MIFYSYDKYKDKDGNKRQLFETIIKLGCGSGQVVNVLAFNPTGRSSNPAEVFTFYYANNAWHERKRTKRGHVKKY